jgi:23S rRNA (cytidine1920-2'-O)/16S rRNA (cytidine1409-2'-O)-methyltransferase
VAGRVRLDVALTGRGLFATRARAADAVRRGTVRVAGRLATKAGALIDPAAAIEVADPARAYVSRAALKLTAGLEHFAIAPFGLVCLDIGASTGGFTQVLLERGAARVYAVDVGHGQLAPSIAADPRVVDLSATDARDLTLALVPEPARLIVADVSFIGLAKALPAALALAAPGGWLVALVKPQFEAGPGAVGRGGVVRKPEARQAAVAGVAAWLGGLAGWSVLGTAPAPIAGGAGNRETLIAARRAG